MRHVDFRSLKRRALGFVPFAKADETPHDPAGGVEHVGLKLPNARSKMGRLILQLPHPLINPDANLVVLYSAKSACTTVLVWFLHHLGHAAAARDFHPWPHRYCNLVYYQSSLYRRAAQLDLTGFKVVKVIRDPYLRAASSFRHVVRYNLFEDGMARKLSDSRLERDGLSFSAFLDFLEKTDLTRCDPHYALQHHPIEAQLPVSHLINVSREDLFARLNEVEREIGLPASDVASSPWVKRLEERYNQASDDFAGIADLYTRRLKREQALNGPWPRYEALLTPEARDRVARLYAADFRAYP